MSVKHYTEQDDLTDVFVGRRIVAVEMGVEAPLDTGRWGYESRVIDGTDPVGLLTLDDGTKVYVVGNDGGCACSAGCYSLTRLAEVDNIITGVRVIDESRGDGDDYDSDKSGRWIISVFAASDEINVAEFEGDDGNGYYGTGFQLAVIGQAA